MKRVAVIGGGIGGLTAAGELARAGHRVTLFEAAATVGGKAQVVVDRGLVFDTGPTLLTMPAVVRETFRRLGAEDLLPRFHRLALQAQYHYADGRELSCWDDLERTVESASAIHPADGAALTGFYREAEAIYRAAGEPYLEAPFDGVTRFLGRVLSRGFSSVLTGLTLPTLAGLARRHFASEHLRQFVGRFATYAGASPFEASGAFAMIAHLERAFGAHHVEGGMGALVRALARAVARLGVEVHTSAPAQWERRGTRFVVREEEFDAVVVNADPLSTPAPPAPPAPLALSGFVFFVETERLSLPHHLVSFSRDYRREFSQLFSGEVPDEPTVYVCHPAATDATMAPAGRSGLFVMVNAPPFTDRARAEAEWPTHAARLRAHCLARLGLPGARVVGERTPLDLARQGAPGGSIYGFLPHGRLGPFRRPALQGPAPGLFFAGGGTHPGGGVPLVMLSGRFASALAARHLGGRAMEHEPFAALGDAT